MITTTQQTTIQQISLAAQRAGIRIRQISYEGQNTVTAKTTGGRALVVTYVPGDDLYTVRQFKMQTRAPFKTLHDRTLEGCYADMLGDLLKF